MATVSLVEVHNWSKLHLWPSDICNKMHIQTDESNANMQLRNIYLKLVIRVMICFISKHL